MMAMTFTAMKQLLLMTLLVWLPIACAPEAAAPVSELAADSTDASGRGGVVESGASPEVPAGTMALSQRCTNGRDGFSVSYPDGWHTNSGTVIPACSAFHPDPFEIPEASEMPFEIAITIGVETVDLDSLRTTSQWEQIVSAERLTIGGREAWRIEARATGEGLAERGMRTLRYAIDLGGGRMLLASTHSAGEAEYPRNQEILGSMIRSLELPR
jgi:hypothetical protein